MQFFAATPLPEPRQLPEMDGSMLKALLLVGGLALAFVVYLIVDWLRARAATRRFEARRRAARDAWQAELREMGEQRPPQDPGAGPAD